MIQKYGNDSNLDSNPFFPHFFCNDSNKCPCMMDNIVQLCNTAAGGLAPRPWSMQASRWAGR